MNAELDAIWNEPGIKHPGNVCIWSADCGNHPYSTPGEERIPTVGKSAEAFMRRIRKHWGPAPMAYCGDAKMIMPKWLRDNYKRNCPNNYKELVKEYGCGVAKLDEAVAKLTFHEAFGAAPRGYNDIIRNFMRN